MLRTLRTLRHLRPGQISGQLLVRLRKHWRDPARILAAGGSLPWSLAAAESATALVFEGEDGAVRRLSFGELNAEVCQAANALRSLGLGKGDAIGIFMPMTGEIVVALLAIAKIGGVILPLFSGYGVDAIVTRLSDAEAKALFTSDGAVRRGRDLPMKSTADQALDQVPSVAHVIVHTHTGRAVEMKDGRDHRWQDLVSSQPREAETEP